VPDTAETDRALMAAMAAGERTALGHVIRRHGPGLRRFLSGILRQTADAEDVAQEAFLRLWTTAGRYDPARAAPSTWLYRIALRLAIDRNRRHDFRRFVGLETAPEPDDDAPDSEAQVAGRERLRLARAGLDGLPDRQRRALLLQAVAGLTTSEIADVLGASTGAVEQLLVRARAGLRAAMGENAT
jgi:RNA polymerase sigma-70 factor, ECF subfamily